VRVGVSLAQTGDNAPGARGFGGGCFTCHRRRRLPVEKNRGYTKWGR
jgi:hypothetical protein